MKHGESASWLINTNTLSSADIARMAGVRPSAVSNWRNRENKNFPKPVDSKDGRPLFDYDEVAAWLTSNGITFEDTRMEQAAWSFFDRWRNQSDPMAMMSLLLWSLCIRTASKRFNLESEWKSFLTTVDAKQSYTDKCQQLIVNLLNQRSDNAAALRMALTMPYEIDQLQPDELSELLHFADDLSSLGTSKMNHLVSMMLERTILSQGRMNAEFGCPKSRVSVLLAKLAAAHISEHESGKQSITVYDPACGILESALQFDGITDNDTNMQQQPAEVGQKKSVHKHTVEFHCADINVRASAIAARRFLLADTTGASLDIHTQDCLVQDPFPRTRADIVLLETPFGLRWEPNDIDARWMYGTPMKNDSALAWVQDALAHLNADGRAFVVTSGGPLFRTGREAEIRRALVAAGCVEAIIALPSNLYINTSIPTFIWVLSAPNSNRDTVSMVSMTVESDAYGVQDQPIEWMETALKWFAHCSPLPVRPLVARNVRSIELLGDPQVTLLPVQWLDENSKTPTEVETAYKRQQVSLANTSILVSAALETLQQFDAEGLDCRDVKNVRLNDIAIIKHGDYSVERKPGYVVSQSDLPEDVVIPKDVKTHHLRDVGPQQDFEEINIATAKNDILLLTDERPHAVVDESGGRRVYRNVHIVRLTDERWNPKYVAMMIEGSWNNNHQAPSILFNRGIRPAQLKIPALPLEQQNRVVSYAQAVETLCRNADLYRIQLDTVKNAAHFGAAIGETADSPVRGESL